MSEQPFDRRQLHNLTLAALGGLVAGTLSGCGSGSPSTPEKPTEKPTEKPPEGGTADATPRLLQEPHVCRGLNTCKNKGKKETTNECAGQGHCATAAEHSCHTANECKGQGGCGKEPGENECKGKGACHVPLKESTWPKARKRFEELMTRAGKKFGEAPPEKS
jgi:hypothetical protein